MALVKIYRLTVMTLFIGLFIAPPLHAALPDTLYVKRDRTVILAEPSGMAKIVAMVHKGIPLEVIGKRGKYYRVKTPKGVTGYVFNMRVTSVNPSSENSIDDDLGLLEATPMGKNQVALGESSGSHSIRGLRKASSKNGKGATGKMAEASVKDMERLMVTGGELTKFQREGGVGRYAR